MSTTNFTEEQKKMLEQLRRDVAGPVTGESFDSIEATFSQILGADSRSLLVAALLICAEEKGQNIFSDVACPNCVTDAVAEQLWETYGDIIKSIIDDRWGWDTDHGETSYGFLDILRRNVYDIDAFYYMAVAVISTIMDDFKDGVKNWDDEVVLCAFAELCEAGDKDAVMQAMHFMLISPMFRFVDNDDDACAIVDMATWLFGIDKSAFARAAGEQLNYLGPVLGDNIHAIMDTILTDGDAITAIATVLWAIENGSDGDVSPEFAAD